MCIVIADMYVIEEFVDEDEYTDNEDNLIDLEGYSSDYEESEPVEYSYDGTNKCYY